MTVRVRARVCARACVHVGSGVYGPGTTIPPYECVHLYMYPCLCMYTLPCDPSMPLHTEPPVCMMCRQSRRITDLAHTALCSLPMLAK